MNNRIKNFFDKHISILHKKGNAVESLFLNFEFGSAKESYFIAPAYPQYLYLNTICFETAEKLEEYLNEFWKDQPALLNLIPDLVELAFSLKAEHKEQSAELSPFVYEMF
jgi:hypothetical protein